MSVLLHVASMTDFRHHDVIASFVRSPISSFNERMDVDAEGKPDMEAAMNVEDEEDEGDEEEEVTVPLTVSVSLMAAYLGLCLKTALR